MPNIIRKGPSLHASGCSRLRRGATNSCSGAQSDCEATLHERLSHPCTRRTPQPRKTQMRRPSPLSSGDGGLDKANRMRRLRSLGCPASVCEPGAEAPGPPAPPGARSTLARRSGTAGCEPCCALAAMSGALARKKPRPPDFCVPRGHGRVRRRSGRKTECKRVPCLLSTLTRMIRADKRRKRSGAGERARKLDRLSMRCFSYVGTSSTLVHQNWKKKHRQKTKVQLQRDRLRLYQNKM